MNIFMSEKYIFKMGRGDLMAPNNFRGIVNTRLCIKTILKALTEGILPISSVYVTA